jgi:hypothetical protein
MPNFEVGDIVKVKGYGGYAEVLGMEEDGVTPQGHTKWLCTVRFGPYEDHVGYVPFGPVRKGVRDRVHQFYSGRMKNIFDGDDDEESTSRSPKVSTEDAQEARKAALREIEIEIALLKAEM